MKRAIVFLALALAAAAQTPGTITVTRTSAIAILAGGLRCTVNTANLGATVQFYCYQGTSTTTIFNAAITTITTAQENGAATHYTLNGDSVTCLFWRPTPTDPVKWQVAATAGTTATAMKEGTF